ncbi:type 4b pilus protein PilO2 [Thioalkalivibrio sp. ALE16]|uniref:type 4b pilus protein PilO2 n=1 Tax=Thioalkalivibrio sp. ALE16 TaxID=1158172 RepID=UPI000377D4CF|nr:type 4b pilus protein PilO2 [Thioalkalivibrio sp. ALE16]
MSQIKLNKKLYLTELEWHGVPAGKAVGAREVQSYEEDGGPPVTGVVHLKSSESLEEDFVGLYRDRGTPPKKAGTLAGTIAKACPEHIIVGEIEDGVWWLMVSHQGGVIPGTDIEGSGREILSALHDHLELFGDQAILVSSADIPGLEGLGDQAKNEVGRALAGASIQGLESIVADVDAVAVEALEKGMSPARQAVTGVAALAFMAGVGWMAWDMFFVDETPQVQTQSEEAEAREQYLQAILRSVNDRIPENSGWAIEAIETAMDRHAVSANGWQFEGVACEPGACTISWVPYSSIRPIRGFEEEAGLPEGALSRSSRGDSLSAQVSIGDVPMRVFQGESDLNQLPVGREIRADWWDFMQLAQFRSPGIDFERSRGTSSVGPAVAPAGMVRLESETLHANGKTLAQLERLLGSLDQTDIRAKKVTFAPPEDGGSSSQWRVEMEYVAKQ